MKLIGLLSSKHHDLLVNKFLKYLPAANINDKNLIRYNSEITRARFKQLMKRTSKLNIIFHNIGFK